MRKDVIFAVISICFISAVSQGQAPNMSVDMLQNMLFGVSTLKGVQEVYPQVQIEVLEATSRELSSTSKIGTLVRNDIQEQVVQALQKANIQIAQRFDNASEDSPLSLNITIFIKVAVADPPIYNTFIYTEALQSVRLGRENSIRSLSRTWPMQPMGLTTRNMFVLNTSKLEDTVKEEVAKQVGTFISDFLAANPNAVPRSAVDIDIDALKKSLFTKESNLQFTLRTNNGRDSQQIKAIKELENSGSEEAINLLLECLTDNKIDSILKQNALTALGRIGTEPAVEAIKKFEDWSKERYSNPKTFYMGPQPNPIDHLIVAPAIPLAQTIDSENKTWALVPLSFYGKLNFFLTSQIKDDTWSEPILLDISGLPELRLRSETQWNIKCQLSIKDDLVKIECNGKSYEVKISDQLKDTDKDGLPDIVEARLFTDPQKEDSDGDGVPDRKDSNPLTPKHKETNEVTEIKQAVFSVMFGTSNSQNALVVVDRDGLGKQEYYGLAGPVLLSSQSIQGFVNLTSIDIKYQSQDAATVTIGDYVGSASASQHQVKLQKIHGKWVVVEFKMTMIS